MKLAQIIMIFAGYTVGSYGWVLLKGYDITFKEWVNPLAPYQYPSGSVPTVPKGHVFPVTTATVTPAPHPPVAMA